MYEHRYEQPRDTLPRSPLYLHHVLTALKNGRADHFRQNLRVNPLTFDALVAALEDDPVFLKRELVALLSHQQAIDVAIWQWSHQFAHVPKATRWLQWLLRKLVDNSNHPQLPVDQQVAVALYRFGHDGNAKDRNSDLDCRSAPHPPALTHGAKNLPTSTSSFPSSLCPMPPTPVSWRQGMFEEEEGANKGKEYY
ncbi:hypothetical protein B0H13DRAFT_2317736 [Mycena leptocephala]|nr:hypothetical protein B0H13DRAFT_2317736 [Mycena leptocephala]